MISHVSHGVVFAPSSVTARYPGDLGHKRPGQGQRALAGPYLLRSTPAGHTEEALLTAPGDAGVCGWGQAGSGLPPVGDHRRVFIVARGLRDSQKPLLSLSAHGTPIKHLNRASPGNGPTTGNPAHGASRYVSLCRTLRRKATVLIENATHHIDEEEQDWFPKVRAGISRKELQ